MAAMLKLRAFSSYVSDPSQQNEALALWEEIKPDLSREQRANLLTAWSKFLRTRRPAVIEEMCSQIIEQQQESQPIVRFRKEPPSDDALVHAASEADES